MGKELPWEVASHRERFAEDGLVVEKDKIGY